MIILFVAVLVFVGFLIQEKRHINPILPFDLMKIKQVKLSFVSMLLLGMLVYGLISILPLYGQQLLGFRAMAGGKMLLLFSVGVGVGGIMSGFLSKKFKVSRLVSISWFLSTTGLILLILANIYHIHHSVHFLFVIIIGIGLGMIIPILLASSQNAVDENRQAVIGGLIQISRNIGGAISIPILTNMIIMNDQSAKVFNGYHLTFILLAMLALLGLFIGFRFKEKE